MRPARPISRFLKPFRLKAARLAIVAALVTIGAGLSWFEPQFILLSREWVWDEMVRAKPRAWDPDLKVRIVNIDEESLAAHGQWPWPRARMARLVDSLHAYGARAIAFDVIFAEPDRTSLANVFDGLRRDVPGYTPPLDPEAIAAQPDNDTILATAVGRIPTVMALSVEETESPNGSRALANLPRVNFERRKDQRYLSYFPGAISALPILQEQAASNASIDPRVDADGITRRAALLYKVGKRTVPSLAAALVLAAKGGGITALTRQPGLRAVAIGDTEIPTDRYGQMRLYDIGSKPGRYVSAADVLSRSLPDEALKDAIAIIGTGAEGLHDLRLTPLDQWVPGMETHAQFTEQILSRDFLERPDWGREAEFAVTLAVGLLLLLAVGLGRTWPPPWIIAVVASGALGLFAWFAFAGHRMLFDPVLPAATLLSAAALDRFLLVLELRRERSAVRSAFGHYVAPAIVELLAENPDRLTLGGERRNMTFLFCDIRGFTAISERFGQNPEGLTQLINRFLTPMSNEILNRGGTIDKYMGDCIMAFWNAPLDDPVHAAHACQSALAMQDALKALNERLSNTAAENEAPITIRAGVGLNTGNCIVGNMGSEQRFDYSVLGDAVNLSSRLEGQSKTYGVDILIGEDTRAAAPEFAALELDMIAVKGRAAAVHVHALLGDRTLREDDDFRNLETAQAALLAAYRAQQWTAARQHASKCRDLARAEWRLDTLYDLYEERIAAYEISPPGTDWTGVYVAESK
ncbi:MAG: adenylate/guanylate cyclase domain-containing protein [Alphaproteobacteria bacterium]